MEKKELLILELRYGKVSEDNIKCVSDRITIGIYSTLEEAVRRGNMLIKELSNTFEVRDDDKFSNNGGCFGEPQRLVSNCCYPTKGIKYFATITELRTKSVKEAIDEAMNSRK